VEKKQNRTEGIEKTRKMTGSKRTELKMEKKPGEKTDAGTSLRQCCGVEHRVHYEGKEGRKGENGT